MTTKSSRRKLPASKKARSAPGAPRQVVRGRVSRTDGSPAADVRIVAVDRDLRTEQTLGEAQTDAAGAFRIACSSNASEAAERGGADLVVRAFTKDGLKLAESAVRFNAGPDEAIDLVVPLARESEWQLIARAVVPLMEGQDVQPGDFTDADIEFIVGEAALDREQLNAWVWAYRAALTQPLLATSSAGPTAATSQRKIDSGPSGGKPASGSQVVDWLFYYSCARNSQPRNVGELLARNTDELLGVTRRAVAANQVPASLLDSLEALRVAINRARVDLHLQPGTPEEPARLGDILNTVSSEWLDANQRRKVVDLVARVPFEAAEFQEQARKSGLSEVDARVLTRSLRLAKLAAGHLPAIAALQPLLTDDGDATLAGLAALEPSRWMEIAYEHGAPRGFTSTPELFALRMRDEVERAAPEAALRAWLDEASAELPGAGFASLGRVLSNNPEFSFAGDDVEEFVATADLTGIKESAADVSSALLKMQSLQRAGVRWREAPVFIGAGIGSIEALAEYGSAGLQKLVGGQIDAQRTVEIAHSAKLMKAAGVGLVSQLMPLLRGASAPVMQPRKLDSGAQKVVDSSPSLRRLFGALEQCACDPCQSVLSPSAYLVDLLNFVARDNGVSWYLQERRADIYDLELSCDNAQIELPHIDLVNEILENAIALPYEVSLPGVTDVVAALKQRPFPAALVAALQQTTWEPLVESTLWAEVATTVRMGTTCAVVADRYRRWGIEIRAGYFGISGHGTHERLDIDQQDVVRLVAALDKRTLPSFDTTGYFGRHALGGSKLPAEAVEISVVPIEPGRRWRITVTVQGKVEIDDRKGHIRYSGAGATVSRKYSAAALEGTRRSLDAQRPGGVLLAETLDASNYAVARAAANAWTYNKTVTYDFVYVPAGVVIKSLSYQCTARDRDLMARPQHRNPRAYRDFLAKAESVYPWTLPYDIDLSETRALSGAAGLGRTSLMQAALPPGDGARRGVLAIEQLGMMRAELTLATTAASDADVWKRWGLKVNGGAATIVDSYDDVPKTGTPLELLSTVSILLQQARLKFLELQWLLQSEFINPGRMASISVPDDAPSAEECDPTRLVLRTSTAQLFDRLHRFVRWQRRLKWKVPELDFALRVLSTLPGTTAEMLAGALADIEALRARLGIPVETLLTAFYGFDRVSYNERKGGSVRVIDPLYERVFQNPLTAMSGGGGAAATRSPDPALAYATLDGTASTITIGERAVAVAACVGLHAHDLLPLLNADYQLAQQPVSIDENTRLGLLHLRLLLSDAALARALNVSPTRLATLIELQGRRPFESPRALLEFCDNVDFIARSGFDVDQLRYVLTHRGAQSFAWVFSENRGQRVLEALQVALRGTESQSIGTAASDALTTTQLATLLDDTTTKAQRIALLAELTQLGSHELERVVASLWPAFADAFTTAPRVRELVDVAVSWQRRAAIVAANLGQALGIDAPLTASLLWFHLRATGNAAAMELFADSKPGALAQRFEHPSRVFEPATIAQSAEFQAVLKLHKFGLLNATWRLAATDVARFPGSSPDSMRLLGLAFDSLPVSSASGRFTDWKRSATLLGLCRASRGLATVVDDYTRAIAPPAADPVAAGAAVWAAALDLPVASVRDFAGAGLLEFGADQAALQQCRDPLRVAGWYELMLLARRYSLGAAEVKLLIAEAPGRATIDVAMRALQARFGETQWRDVMVKAGNALRIEQRDRLVDYLLWRDGLRDADSLYERYLIDVQMAPCMTTTRLLQAIGAVQLYVQRCLMNLEAGIEPATVDPDRQWEWRKNYRVWEANRKIFLYPENWLYPELRDDKSEIYRGFESALMQAEASDANAGNAVQGYLESLTDIAQISIMGMYEEAPRANAAPGSARRPYKTLHVVGRSPDPPYTYFYRSNQQNGEAGSRWTPWERISLDLPACHVVSFVLGGELHLVWPIIELEQDSQTHEEYYNVRLAWSRRTSLGWAQRKVAAETATRIEKHFKRDERGSLALKLSEQQSGPRMAAVELYIARKTPSVIDEAALAANIVAGSYEPGERTGSYLSNWTFCVRAYVKYLDTGRIVPVPGCHYSIVGLQYGSSNFSGWDGVYFFGAWTGPDRVRSPASAPGFAADGTTTMLTVHNDAGTVLIEGTALIDGAVQTVTTDTYSIDPPLAQLGTGAVSANLLFSAIKDPDFDDPAIDTYARVKMDLQGRFLLEAGRDTRWITDGNGTMLPMPDEVMSWESRLRERNTYTQNLTAGLHSSGAQTVFQSSQAQSNYVSLRAARGSTGGAETWYWEESVAGGTSRFLALLGAGNPATLITVQPGGFEDAREYRYRYSTGREALFTPEAQEAPTNTRFGVDALSRYFPGTPPAGVDPRSVPLLQFHLGMPYASYNWEVFYHLPMAAARFLATQQRFEEAQRWLACVFDPTSNDSALGRERYWRCLPLRYANAPLSIQQLMRALADPAAEPAIKQGVQDQIAAWEANPFSPFAVARARTSAYEWHAVTAYVTNLIEWGDSLFRRDTRESINEAALLYVFASKILGRRPEVVPKQGFQPGPLSYRAIGGRWDDFSNAWVRLIDTPLGKFLLEWLLALQRLGGYNPHAYDQQIEQLASIGSLYFCIPQNEKLLQLWDTVADRQWKIRHCQNIDGVQRPLALLDPPIDPELLIRARLAGVDMADVLADLHAPLPNYRYTFLLQKALEFCGELKALGGALLVAIEKKDGEKLSLLRSQQEISMLGLVEAVKLDQVAEADANIRALEQTRLGVVARYRYLQRMLGNNDVRFDGQGVPVMDQHGTLQVRDAGAPGDFRGLALVQSEVDQVSRMQDAHIASIVAGALKLGAAAGRGTAAVLSAYGLVSQPAANAANFVAQALFDLGDVGGLVATNADQWSRRSGLIASFQRRREEWIQQAAGAVEEIRQIDKQIAAANIRKAISEKDLANHRRSIENAREIDDYLRERKFSTAELHGWMETQLMTTHHAAYQLAFDLAKRLERAWRRELGESESQWIRFGYWDGAKKGLQAGEQLHVDLNRMQIAYIERSKREYEITKHVSLLALDPAALVELRESGTCEICVPEALFDLDYPGHYFRRLKTVSLSIPCVVGPYGGVPATLKLLRSSVRTKTGVAEGYARIEDDTRFVDTRAGVEAVVTSSGQNDSGLFETNLRDERFLPFEGSGAIATWQVVLPDEFRAFDYDTIPDVILHLRYTAREGGEDLKNAALGNLRAALNAVARMNQQQGLARMFSLRQDFPTEWHRLTNDADTGTASTVSLTISKNRFPYLFSSNRVAVRVTAVDLYSVPTPDIRNPRFPAFVRVFVPGEQTPLGWGGTTTIGPLPGKSAAVNVAVAATDPAAIWRLEVPGDDVATLKAESADLLMVFRYVIA